MEYTKHVPRKAGRPLSFDREAALREAMLLFWRHGYESTSLSALTRAMGINAPSVYTAYGDKKGLFRAAVELYLSGPVTAEALIDGAASARDAAGGLLRAAAIGFTGLNTPRGCLLASAAISCSPASADVQQELTMVRQRTEARLKTRIVADQRAGALDSKADAGALAAHVMAVIQGMSSLARDGASRAKLLKIVATALRAWPT